MEYAVTWTIQLDADSPEHAAHLALEIQRDPESIASFRLNSPPAWGYPCSQGGTMTELLKKAFEEASRLPQAQQDALASFLLEEIRSDRAWAEIFARSQDRLEQLADDAIQEHEAGKTNRLDPFAP